MRLPSFSIVNNRSIRLASCDSVPRIMILTGPNGCGKSTLLYALRSNKGEGRIIYVGPHRNTRRQQVQARFLLQKRIEMRSLLSSQNVSGIDGVRIYEGSRDAWSFDEAGNYLKFSLCQLEFARQSGIVQKFDKDGSINEEDIPDIWQPLREMTENLLPHLHFKKIDISSQDNVRCLWSVHSKGIDVDIDDLSSGEKAIVQLFFSPN